MPRLQPEGVIYRPGRRLVVGSVECRRPDRLGPGPAAVKGAEDGRAQVAGLGGDQLDLGIARVLDEVVDDLAQKQRPLGPP